MPSLKIIATADGSHSLLNEDLGETYHSSHGAVQESRHVFINNGLDYIISNGVPASISILEIGFGTGLNALLTWQHVMNRGIAIEYTAIEPFPVPPEIWQHLNYAQDTALRQAFTKIHEAPWDTNQAIDGHFQLLKCRTTLEQFSCISSSYDLVYFDAFSPGKQPELWTLPALEKIADGLNDAGIFVTYCAKGQLKRNLKALGLVIESLPGPPGKREMVRAIKTSRVSG